MNVHAPELTGYSEREARLKQTIDQYVRLSIKSDGDALEHHELDELLVAEMSMKRQARALGLSHRQLELMVARARGHHKPG